MTQSYNLSQLANNLTSAGLLDAADGLVNAVPIANGGTGASTASAARTNLDVAQAVYAVPSGGIILWSGSTGSIPTGWFLCDGTNSTPDLRSKFIVGAGSTYAVNATGGSANSIVPSHTHAITDAGHNHQFNYAAFDWTVQGGPSTVTANRSPTAGTTTTATTGISINTAGVSPTNANLPPYYALAYIMKS
jgi:hypothetical protein